MRLFFGKSMLVAAACCTGAAQAGGDYLQGWGIAPQTRFYAGGSLGAANQNEYEDGNAVAGKLYGGLRYGRYLGAEVGYAALGDAETTGEGRVKPSLINETDGLYAAVMGYIPMAQRTELFAKAGVMKWDSDYTANYKQTHNDNGYPDSSGNGSGTSPLIGVGAQYHLNPNMQLRGEWERVIGTGDKINDNGYDYNYESDIDLLTVGLTISTF